MTLTHPKTGIEIRLEVTNYITRRRCLFCGESTDKNSIVAEVYENGERTGYVVCPHQGNHRGCLGEPPGELAARLRQRVACLRAEADELEALAADPPMVPTQEQFRSAYRDYSLERFGHPYEFNEPAKADKDGLFF
jgi:hypothetical protein